MKKILATHLLMEILAGRELYIDYGAERQGQELFKYFHGISDEFYVDIGAFDPIFVSNTLNLYSQGWRGINIDANPTRLAAFNIMRPSDINIHTAMGEEGKFLTLFEMDNDSTATVVQKVKQFQIDQKQRKVVEEINVPSMSMKQLCERFFQKKPLFLSLDVEGYDAKVLMENDWDNTKCRPEIIFTENNDLSENSGLVSSESIMVKNNYKKVPGKVGFN